MFAQYGFGRSQVQTDIRSQLGITGDSQDGPGGPLALPSVTPQSTSDSSPSYADPGPPVLMELPSYSDAQATHGGGDQAGVGWSAHEASYANAVTWIDSLRLNNKRDYKKVVAALRAAHYLGSNTEATVSAVQSAWRGVVADAASEYAKGNPVTPLTILNMKATGSGDGATGGPSGGGGSGPKTTTQTNTSRSVNLTDRTTAQGILDQALTQYLGRAATPSEVSAFMAALNRSERDHPNVSQNTVTTTTNADGTSQQNVSDTTSSGGVNASQKAINWAKKQEGAAEYQAATTYMDAFLGALGGVG